MRGSKDEIDFTFKAEARGNRHRNILNYTFLGNTTTTTPTTHIWCLLRFRSSLFSSWYPSGSLNGQVIICREQNSFIWKLRILGIQEFTWSGFLFYFQWGLSSTATKAIMILSNYNGGASLGTLCILRCHKHPAHPTIVKTKSEDIGRTMESS